jgi:type VI secretion system secreted protein Hcp
MAAYMKLGDIKGDVSNPDHKEWIMIESMSAPIYRSIASGARNQGRTQGETTLGDITVIKQLDKSSTKIQEASAKGDFQKEVEIHLCTDVKGKEEPYLKYKLENVIISSYSFHGNSSGSPLPTEQLSLNYTKVTWTYVVVNKDTGKKEGQVETMYDKEQATAG